MSVGVVVGVTAAALASLALLGGSRGSSTSPTTTVTKPPANQVRVDGPSAAKGLGAAAAFVPGGPDVLGTKARSLGDFLSFQKDIIPLPTDRAVRRHRVSHTGGKLLWRDPRVLAAEEGWTRDDLDRAAAWWQYQARAMPGQWTGAGAVPDWTDLTSTEGVLPLAVGHRANTAAGVLTALPYLPRSWRDAWLKRARSGMPPAYLLEGDVGRQLFPWTAQQWWQMSAGIANDLSEHFGIAGVNERALKNVGRQRMAKYAGLDDNPNTTPSQEATQWFYSLVVYPLAIFISAYTGGAGVGGVAQDGSKAATGINKGKNANAAAGA